MVFVFKIEKIILTLQEEKVNINTFRLAKYFGILLMILMTSYALAQFPFIEQKLLSFLYK